MKLTFGARCGISILLSFIAVALTLFAAGGKQIPGPYMTFRGDFLPHFFSLSAVGIALYRSQELRLPRRLIALVVSGIGLAASVATGLFTYASFHHPFARGPLFEW